MDTEDLAQELEELAELGIGLPRAVQLGGPAKIEDWCAEQRAGLEAQLARTDPETGDVGETVGEFLDRKLEDDHGTGDEATPERDRLEALAAAQEAAEDPGAPSAGALERFVELEEALEDRKDDYDHVRKALKNLKGRVTRLEKAGKGKKK